MRDRTTSTFRLFALPRTFCGARPTPRVRSRWHVLSPSHAVPRARRWVAIALAFGLVGCSRAEQTAADVGDPVWRADSLLLASRPPVVFRALDHERGRAVVPITLMGPQALRLIRLGGRGWEAFDTTYLSKGRVLNAIRDGRVLGQASLTRRMWEPLGALDSLPGCPRVIPAGLADVPRDVHLLVSGERPKAKAVDAISPGMLASVLATVPTLIAPSKGIPTEMMSRYTREAHVLSTGSTSRPTILVIYRDPRPVSDTVRPIAQRPRQLIVLLDQGQFGYRPTYTFTTLGNAQTPPKLSFLDYFDVDGDGVAELFFTSLRSQELPTTVVLRFGRDETWREVFNEMVRCQL